MNDSKTILVEQEKARRRQAYRTAVGIVADEIWLRSGWSAEHCAVLRPPPKPLTR